MKHLKKFNESIEDKETLQDFCETYLAFLVDNGFNIKIEESIFGYEVNITNQKDLVFTWDSIKDSFIPFLHILRNNYEVGFCNPTSKVPSIKKSDIMISDFNWRGIYFRIKDLIKNDSTVSFNIKRIFLLILRD